MNQNFHIDMKIILGFSLALLVPVSGAILTDAPIIWPVSILIYNLGLFYSFALFSKKTLRTVVYIIFAATLFVIESTYFISYYIQNTGFNEAFFYHIRPDLIHAGISEHLSLFCLIVVCMLSFLIVSSSCLNQNRSRKSWMPIVAVSTLIFGLYISPPARALALYFGNLSPTPSEDALFENFLELRGSKNITVKFTKSKRPNIVLIYAESLEQRFFDESLFPGLVPNLKNLRENSIYFSNVSQGVGAGWTIGGIVASQCSYPLAVEHDVDPNDLNIFDEFLPNATCLGDLLKKDGYQLSFIGGADARFAGKEKFLRSHGYDEVMGLRELKSFLIDDTYISPWGLFDDTLFDYATKKFMRLSAANSPFLMTLLTLDSHGFEGNKSKSCRDYQSGENSILNTIHCTDQLLSRFIEQIRKSPYSDETVIVVVSDHLAMRNKATPLLKNSKMPSRLTFFIDTPQSLSDVNSNPGLHYDISPTILETLGYEISGQMGFGKSLVEGVGYLPGKFGENEWQKLSPDIIKIANTLWDDEIFLDQSGIDFTVSNLALNIGGRGFNLRAGGFIDVPSTILFLFDNNSLKLEKINSYPLEQGLSQETLGEILLNNKEKFALVISRSENLPGFSDQRLNPEQWVFFCGRPGSYFFSSGPITNDFLIPFDLVKKLSQSKIDDEVVRERQRILNVVLGKKT